MERSGIRSLERSMRNGNIKGSISNPEKGKPNTIKAVTFKQMTQ